jgi:hypothetical protein
LTPTLSGFIGDHMFSAQQPTQGRRWPRGQRFTLSTPGVEAEAAYRAAVMDVRSLGRDALAQAERRWAEALGLSPADGVVMAEIRPGRRSLADLARALEACGTPASQIRESVDRLVEKGLVEALPLPGAVVPPAA